MHQLELINDLPELLLGQDQLDKRIICDFDDFELGESESKNKSVIELIDTFREQTKSPRVLKAQLRSKKVEPSSLKGQNTLMRPINILFNANKAITPDLTVSHLKN